MKYLPIATSAEDYYYWYYGSLAAYMHKGEFWEKWNPVMRDLLLSRQVKSGGHAGSWNPKGSHGSAMGRVISTAMATLILEVYYRYGDAVRSFGTAPDLDDLFFE